MPTKLAGTKFTLGDDFRVDRSVVSVAAPVSLRAAGVGRSKSGAENRAAIEAAVIANPGRVLMLPPESIAIAGTVDITTDGTIIMGYGPSVSKVLQQTADVDTFVFKPTTAGVTSAFLNTPAIQGVYVDHSAVAATSTTGAGVRFVQCNGYSLFDVSINNAAEGLTIQGGQLGSLKKFQLFASTGLDLTDSGLLYFRQAPVGAGFQPCYTVEVEDFRMSATKLRSVCIYIRNADGLKISNGYAAFGKYALVRVKAERDNSYVSGVVFTGAYLDCVGPTHTPYGIDIPDDGFASSYVYQLSLGSGCTIGNGSQIGILSRKTGVQSLKVGCDFLNMGSWAIDIEGGSATDLLVHGANFKNIGTGGSAGAIRAVGGRLLNIVGSGFAAITNQVVALGGTFSAGTIVGNTNSSSVAELNQGATFTNGLTVAGNSGPDNAAATSWSGVRPGNRTVANTTALDWYEENTFTPTLSFGGASTGITYSSQVGRFTRIGNRVLFSCSISLTSKGSATGTNAIGGLPYAAASSVNVPVALRMNNMANNVGEGLITAVVFTGSTSVAMYKYDVSGGTEVHALLTDADFADTSVVSFSGNYDV